MMMLQHGKGKIMTTIPTMIKYSVNNNNTSILTWTKLRWAYLIPLEGYFLLFTFLLFYVIDKEAGDTKTRPASLLFDQSLGNSRRTSE